MPEKIEEKGIALTIHEETWPYIDEFFRNVPEATKKVPTFQEALAASEHIISSFIGIKTKRFHSILIALFLYFVILQSIPN